MIAIIIRGLSHLVFRHENQSLEEKLSNDLGTVFSNVFRTNVEAT